jgi:uncharacterized membrane protein
MTSSSATHIALIVTHAAYVIGAVVMLYELIRLRRIRWRGLAELRRDRRRGSRGRPRDEDGR